MKRLHPFQLPAWALLAALAAALSAAPASAAGVEVAVGAGTFGVLDDHGTSEGSLEARFGIYPLPHFPRWLRLQPTCGAFATDDGGAYAYAGFRLPFALDGRWTVTPFSGVGAYHRGDGKNLGGTVEFRSGLELAVRLGERSRLGASFYHLSSAGIYQPNPGVESLELVYAYRFGG